MRFANTELYLVNEVRITEVEFKSRPSSNKYKFVVQIGLPFKVWKNLLAFLILFISKRKHNLCLVQI